MYQLLQIQGIRPAVTLASQGIAPVLINENIGQHINDHNVFSIMATSTSEASTNQWIFNITKLAASRAEFYANASDRYTAPSGITNAFQMLSVEHLQSMGASAVIDYGDAPLINPNYYSHPTDRIVATNAFRDLRKIFAHPSLSQYTVGLMNGEVSPGPSVTSDDDDAIFEYIKATTLPNWHASGTNRMLPLADGGVVDSRLRVYGVNGLRVVDSSVMPTVPDVNIQGPVFMIEEHGAKTIREDWQF
ncbi:hypothetical protein LTR66_004826 [Elasticomyces elasticus]|nr:hypothetical protein LTR66_004826 [Elasticomyces elasticus]